jgi:hypothetical protein
VVVLQNLMDLLKVELGSSNETCLSSLNGNGENDIEAERVLNMTEEEAQESTTIPVIKTEPTVSVVPVVKVTHISYRLYPELPAGISVCPRETKI